MTELSVYIRYVDSVKQLKQLKNSFADQVLPKMVYEPAFTIYTVRFR